MRSPPSYPGQLVTEVRQMRKGLDQAGLESHGGWKGALGGGEGGGGEC